jgi:hypothetical protein
MAWRYLAQRALTGEWLDWDLPIAVSELEWQLSGAGQLSGTISPDYASLHAADGRPVLDEWGTFLYAEADGQIRWGGILVSSGFEGSAWKLEAMGFAGYPKGIPYTGEWRYSTVDPLNAVREIWRHVQSFPDGDVGMIVDTDTSPVRVGGGKAEPYELAWYESKDCGDEIDSLAKETPFDYVESHTWADNASDTITHKLSFGYPRLGRRREDLAFVQGENIDRLVTAERSGDNYANEVVGIGAGEGRAMLRRTTAVRDNRLRRSAVYSDKLISTSTRMDSTIRRELQRRLNTLQIDSIEVSNHSNARIGSWALGDDILVRAEIPWLGEISLWCRVVAWSLLGENRAKLTLQRSDSFTYGA